MHMKTRLRFAAMLAAVFVLFDCFPAAASMTDESISLSENTVKTVKADQATSPSENTVMAEKETSPSENSVIAEEEISLSENTVMPTSETVPDEAPAFQARIEFRQGYSVIGTFKDFTPDIIQIQTLYSLDEKIWEVCASGDWNLYNLGTDDEAKLDDLQNQPCLFSNYEPLKSYIAGKIDCFYLKLRITQQNGNSYETQSAAIERGGLQSIPEGTQRRAMFSSAIAVTESAPNIPYRRRKYGRYQLTVSTDATPAEISALLPSTLPVEIQLDHGPDFIAIGIVDCPVTWKPLSLPQLTAGESITISDAAEEILVSEGTPVSTPIGTFLLDEPLSLDAPPSTDEVRLVLNVIEDRNPTGVLRTGRDGLEMAFHNKPTGAVSIRAYILTEGSSKWTELSGLSLLEEFCQPSTAESGYALILRNDQEPYQSYLAAMNAGGDPLPFFVGLKIEGGIYDGRQLILAWPDIYEELPELPKIDGAGGNEGNAGADNKEDSTESGQRPNLPQTPDDNSEEQNPNPPQTTGNDQKEPKSNALQTPDNNPNEQKANPHQALDDNREKQKTNPPQTPDEHQEEMPPASNSSLKTPKVSESGQRPNLPQTAQNTAQSPLVAQAAPNTKTEGSAVILSNLETDMEYHTEAESRMPLLLIAAAVAAVICIAAVVRKTAGSNLISRLSKK